MVDETIDLNKGTTEGVWNTCSICCTSFHSDEVEFAWSSNTEPVGVRIRMITASRGGNWPEMFFGEEPFVAG